MNESVKKQKKKNAGKKNFGRESLKGRRGNQ